MQNSLLSIPPELSVSMTYQRITLSECTGFPLCRICIDTTEQERR
jgi:hypothetical protein